MAMMPRPRPSRPDPAPPDDDVPELHVRVPSPSTVRPRTPTGEPGWRPTIARPSSIRPDDLDALMDEFAARWARGVRVQAEEYLGRLRGRDPSDAIELIYHEFCLAEAAGLAPEPSAFLARFPAHRDRLTRLFGLHEGLSPSQLGLWVEPEELPRSGDEIGPYRLLRELGRGAFARVFLAEQGDLDDRLVVLKVATRATPEPRLLARARHPHIVEVLDHGPAGDGSLHLLGMPFSGGATLADALAALARARPRRGADLLAALDRASAPEYRGTTARSPSRERLAGVSYPKAVAWIVARLAEALAHAHRRGVSHGDLKPSNVLLTASGVPMLFDFNLALDWRARDEVDALTDRGGTLVYMAPERLTALARPESAAAPSIDARQRADLYGLGLVLAEALGGPLEAPSTHLAALAGGSSIRSLAGALASRRGPDGPELHRLLSRAPAALRPILARCLAADPADRYGRAHELAEDLDRFCEDRPPLYAGPPGWPTDLSRWLRRHRPALVAAALVLAVGLSTAAAVSRSFQTSLTHLAQAKLARHWDGEAGAALFPFGRESTGGVTPGPEANLANLQAYEALENPDWRKGDDVRGLPEPERLDLECWLVEQAYRYARAVAERPEAPASWHRRAGMALANIVGRWDDQGPVGLVAAKVVASSRETPSETKQPAPGWIVSYIDGLAAELDGDTERALQGYRKSLADRPDAFWSRYRAAVASWRLGDFPAAVANLERAVASRPGNARLLTGLSGLYLKLGRPSEALDAANRVLALAPDLDEAWHTRLLARSSLGQTADLAADLAELGRLAGASDQPHAWALFANAASHFGTGFDPSRGDPDSLLGASRELDARQWLVRHWVEQGDNDRAAAEVERALARDPGYVPARYVQFMLERTRDPARAQSLAEELTQDEGFTPWLTRQPELLRIHRYLSGDLMGGDRAGEARDQIRIALAQLAAANPERSPTTRQIEGELHYSLARAMVAAYRHEDSSDDPVEARRHLDLARRLIPEQVASWSKADWLIQSLDLRDTPVP
jgi:serine/threonine protein kinase